jgi:hypothetical protein
MSSYADVEAVLVAYLTAAFPAARVGTETPSAMPTQMIQVERIGGPDAVPSIDPATVDVECFAATRAGATDLANKVRASLRFAASGYTMLGATIARVDTIVGPGWRPYADTNARRVGATYQITLHNHQ